MGNKIVTYAIYAIILWWVMGRLGIRISTGGRSQYPSEGGGFTP